MPENRAAFLFHTSSPARPARSPALRVCVKRRYRTKQMANAALDVIEEKRNPVGSKRPIRAYRCPFCHGWHLTSSVHRSRRK